MASLLEMPGFTDVEAGVKQSDPPRSLTDVARGVFLFEFSCLSRSQHEPLFCQSRVGFKIPTEVTSPSIASSVCLLVYPSCGVIVSLPSHSVSPSRFLLPPFLPPSLHSHYSVSHSSCVFYWSPSLPNSLSPFQTPSHMVHQ